MKTKLAVFGATGAQGSTVLEQAVLAGHPVRAIARSPQAAAERFGSAVEPFAADLGDTGSIARALDGVDAAFLHLPVPNGPDDGARQLGAFLEAAHSVQLPFLVFSTGGPVAPELGDTIISVGGRQATEAVLASGIPSIVLHPNLYLENLLAPFSLDAVLAEGRLTYPPFPADLPVNFISQADQGRFVLAALEHRDLAGEAFEIASPGAITANEIADILSKWTGRPVRFEPHTPDAFASEVGALLQSDAIAFVLENFYSALAATPLPRLTEAGDRAIDALKVKLSPAREQILAWPAPVLA